MAYHWDPARSAAIAELAESLGIDPWALAFDLDGTRPPVIVRKNYALLHRLITREAEKPLVHFGIQDSI